MWKLCVLAIGLVTLYVPAACGADRAAADPQLARDVLPLLKTRCVKCHGPTKQEAKLNLSTPGGLARGGENGPPIMPGQPAASLLWQRIDDDEMPPDDPLPEEERALLKRWIAADAKDLPEVAAVELAGSDHWAFARWSDPKLPAIRDTAAARTEVDRFVLARLEAQGLTLNAEADRPTLVRRVSFDLTGLPPTPDAVHAFVADTAPDAYGRMVDRYLASPHYGQRWGKYWLDAAGYADSNGYFNADTDRPLAYRYRDYVIAALNQDKPFDRFVLEQIAGDELSGFVPGKEATGEMISLLEATHYLRNGQDGSGESDGNPDEVRTDRYAALESTMQIVASSLLGLTLQCAKCHDHKFEPISQREYYQLQSVFYPAFDIQNWLKPNDRFVHADLPGEVERWERRGKQIDGEIAALLAEFGAWVRGHRQPNAFLFRDEFDENGPPLVDHWSATAPGDDAPAGAAPVQLDSSQAPGAWRHNGALEILESGAAGDRWLSTRQSFDWTPEGPEGWIQATFDLVDNKTSAGQMPAERIAYLIAMHDFNDNSSVAGGNVLLDGNPAGGAAVHLDYPGEDSKSVGVLGTSKYEPGHNYGVRITRLANGKFRLEHMVDWVPDNKTLELAVEDLPDGSFGFEYCCGRSFVVDNVWIMGSQKGLAPELHDEFLAKEKALTEAVKARQAQRGERPGKIACVTDRSAQAPDVFLLQRGNYATPGEKVEPAPLAALSEAGTTLEARAPFEGSQSTGRRLAWARWLTRENSRSAALVARVQANRLWQHHFGTGIVATPDNLGTSGAPPSHPELLDYLAGRFAESGWSTKALHRLVLNSAVYRQTSALQPAAYAVDPDNRLLWRHSLQRLDAESLRDAMLVVSGQLDRQFGGPYVPTTRDELGEVLVKLDTPGANRRSIYLQQRRTQTLSLLNVFDAPTMVFNCVQRPASTMPLQSLSLLNSEFVVGQARNFAERLVREAGDRPEARVNHAFLLTVAREATPAELQAGLEFVTDQRNQYAGQAEAEARAWADFCQMMLASNAFLYVE